MQAIGWLMIAVGIWDVCAAVIPLMNPSTAAVAVIMRDSFADTSVLVTASAVVSLAICAAQFYCGSIAVRRKPTKAAAVACLCMGIFLAVDGTFDMVYGQADAGITKLVEATVLICYYLCERTSRPRGIA